MKTPLDICSKCYGKYSSWEPEFGPEQWETSVKDQETLWCCPQPPSPNDYKGYKRDGQEMIYVEKGMVEDFPPSWCPWRVELLMMKDSHPHPGHNI